MKQSDNITNAVLLVGDGRGFIVKDAGQARRGYRAYRALVEAAVPLSISDAPRGRLERSRFGNLLHPRAGSAAQLL